MLQEMTLRYGKLEKAPSLSIQRRVCDTSILRQYEAIHRYKNQRNNHVKVHRFHKFTSQSLILRTSLTASVTSLISTSKSITLFIVYQAPGKRRRVQIRGEILSLHAEKSDNRDAEASLEFCRRKYLGVAAPYLARSPNLTSRTIRKVIKLLHISRAARDST